MAFWNPNSSSYICNMEKDYKTMTPEEQHLIDKIQVLSFEYINDKDLTEEELKKLLISIIYLENEATKQGLQNGIGRIWLDELSKYLEVKWGD